MLLILSYFVPMILSLPNCCQINCIIIWIASPWWQNLRGGVGIGITGCRGFTGEMRTVLGRVKSVMIVECSCPLPVKKKKIYGIISGSSHHSSLCSNCPFSVSRPSLSTPVFLYFHDSSEHYLKFHYVVSFFECLSLGRRLLEGEGRCLVPCSQNLERYLECGKHSISTCWIDAWVNT